MLLALLAACSSNHTLDTEQLEAELRAELLPEYPGAVEAVTCPGLLEPQPGETLTCSAFLAGQQIDIVVEIGGDIGALTSTARIDARLVALDEVARLLTSTFEDEIGLATTVDCGQPVIVLEAGQSFRCDATDPSGLTRAFDVSLADDGELQLTLL